VCWALSLTESNNTCLCLPIFFSDRRGGSSQSSQLGSRLKLSALSHSLQWHWKNVFGVWAYARHGVTTRKAEWSRMTQNRTLCTCIIGGICPGLSPTALLPPLLAVAEEHRIQILKKIYGCISFFVILINSYILLEINNKDQSTLIIIIIIISRIF